MDMKFNLVTQVAGNHREVFRRFDKELLLKLTPPGMKAELKRYDEPTAVGSVVELNVTMLGLIKQEWENDITDYEENDAECYFVDEGRKLPWPLKSWRHKHLIRKAKTDAGMECVEIVDDIEYTAGGWTPFIHPVVWLQFAYRKPLYRKFFGKAQ